MSTRSARCLTSRPPSGGGDKPDEGGGTRRPAASPDRTGGGGGQARPVRRSPRGDGGASAVPRPTRSPRRGGGQQGSRASSAAEPDGGSASADGTVVVPVEPRTARRRASRETLPGPGALARRRTVRRVLNRELTTSGPTTGLGGTGAPARAGASGAHLGPHAIVAAGATRRAVAGPSSGAVLARRRLMTPAPLATTATGHRSSDDPALEVRLPPHTAVTAVTSRSDVARSASVVAPVRRRPMTPGPLAISAAARRSAAAVHRATTERTSAFIDQRAAPVDPAPRQLAPLLLAAPTTSRPELGHPRTPSVSAARVVQRTTLNTSSIADPDSHLARLGTQASIHAAPGPQPSAPRWFAPAITQRPALSQPSTPASATPAVPAVIARRSTPPTAPVPDVRAFRLVSMLPPAADRLLQRTYTGDGPSAHPAIVRRLTGYQRRTADSGRGTDQPQHQRTPAPGGPSARGHAGRDTHGPPRRAAPARRVRLDLLAEAHDTPEAPERPPPIRPLRRSDTLRHSDTPRVRSDTRPFEAPVIPATDLVSAAVAAPLVTPARSPEHDPNGPRARSGPATSGRPAPRQTSLVPRSAPDRDAAVARHAHADKRLLDPERRVRRGPALHVLPCRAGSQQRTVPADSAVIQRIASLPRLAPPRLESHRAGHAGIGAPRTSPGSANTAWGRRSARPPSRPSPTRWLRHSRRSAMVASVVCPRHSVSRLPTPAARPSSTRALGLDPRPGAASPLTGGTRRVGGAGPWRTADVAPRNAVTVQRTAVAGVRPTGSGPLAGGGAASGSPATGGRPTTSPPSSSAVRRASGGAPSGTPHRPTSPRRPIRRAERFRAALAERRPDALRPMPAHLVGLARSIVGDRPVALSTGPTSRHALRTAGVGAAADGHVVHLPAPPDRSRHTAAVVAHELVHVARCDEEPSAPVPR